MRIVNPRDVDRRGSRGQLRQLRHSQEALPSPEGPRSAGDIAPLQRGEIFSEVSRFPSPQPYLRRSFSSRFPASWSGARRPRSIIYKERSADPMALVGRGSLSVTLMVALCALAASPAFSSPEEDFVRKTVSSHEIVIFSKSYCPYDLLFRLFPS